MTTTRWTAEALQVRLRAEHLLESGGNDRRALALKRLELLRIVKQVESNAISTDFATAQLEALTNQIQVINKLPSDHAAL